MAVHLSETSAHEFLNKHSQTYIPDIFVLPSDAGKSLHEHYSFTHVNRYTLTINMTFTGFHTLLQASVVLEAVPTHYCKSCGKRPGIEAGLHGCADIKQESDTLWPDKCESLAAQLQRTVLCDLLDLRTARLGLCHTPPFIYRCLARQTLCKTTIVQLAIRLSLHPHPLFLSCRQV